MTPSIAMPSRYAQQAQPSHLTFGLLLLAAQFSRGRNILAIDGGRGLLGRLVGHCADALCVGWAQRKRTSLGEGWSFLPNASRQLSGFACCSMARARNRDAQWQAKEKAKWNQKEVAGTTGRRIRVMRAQRPVRAACWGRDMGDGGKTLERGRMVNGRGIRGACNVTE